MGSMTSGRHGRDTRRIAVGAMLGALMAMLAVTLLARPDSGADPGAVADGRSAPPTTTTPPPLQAASPGACLVWTAVDASDAERVACRKPHLFEVTGQLDLSRRFGDDARFPSNEQWRSLVAARCTEVTEDYLEGRFDPFGRFSVGAIKPSEGSWRRGDRELRCGLQVVGRSGALYPSTGAAASQDQSDVHEPGTCLGNDGLGIGDPVDCAQPHAVEVVGLVDLSEEFPDGVPKEGEQDQVLEEKCIELAAEYAGGPDVVGEQGLTVFWETLRPQSWKAGSRRVNCRLGAFLPDRSGFAPVTGSVTGKVKIGSKPAPPSPTVRGPAPSWLRATTPTPATGTSGGATPPTTPPHPG